MEIRPMIVWAGGVYRTAALLVERSRDDALRHFKKLARGLLALEQLVAEGNQNVG